MYTDKQCASFTHEIASLLTAGISVREGLDILKEEAENDTDRNLYGTLLEKSEKTGTLWQALEDVRQFPDYLVEMCHLGEEAGTLDEVMEGLSSYYEREDDIKNSVRTSVTYPLVMGVLMSVVILILLVLVMPVFREVYNQLGTDLTGVSLTLYKLGEWIRKYAFILIPLVLVLTALFIGMQFATSPSSFLYTLGSKIKSIRSSRENSNTSRFADGMHLCLKAGLLPERSLELCQKICEDPDSKTRIDQVIESYENGEDLIESLKSEKVLTSAYARIASIGNKSGRLEEAMADISNHAKDAIETDLNNRLSVIEPVTVILLSVFMGLILLSVMLPLLSIMSSL